MKMLYRPTGMIDPIEVEVLEVDFLAHTALIEHPVPPEALINMGGDLPQIVSVKRRVHAVCLFPIPDDTDPEDDEDYEDHPAARADDFGSN